MASTSIAVDIGAASHAAMDEAMGDLSPQAAICLSAINQTMGSVLGDAAQSAIATVAKTVADSAAASAVNTVSDIANQIPLIGAIVGWAAFVVGDILGMAEKERQARQAADQQTAQRYVTFKPIGSGQGGRVMPSDIVGLYTEADAFKLGGTWTKYPAPFPGGSITIENLGPGITMPLLGWALIRCTESPSEIEAGADSRMTFPEGTLRTDYHDVVSYVRQQRDPKAGLEGGTRRLLHKLRVAIGRQRMYQPRGSTDGGTSLWPAYMDILRREVDAGRLSVELIRAMIGAAYVQKIKGPKKTLYLPPTNPPIDAVNGDLAARSILTLIDNWWQTVDPWYSQDKAQQKALEEQARKIILSHMMRFPKGAREMVGKRRRIKLAKRVGAAGGVLLIAKLLGWW